jgi:hypothetical protein
MSNRLDRFNSLPPKPMHSKRVRSLLGGGDEFNVSEIVARTGLTRTQVLCALDPMVRDGEVIKWKNSMRFRLSASLPIEQPTTSASAECSSKSSTQP